MSVTLQGAVSEYAPSALSGAGAGAVAGTAIAPGLGTAIGAGLGAVVSLGSSLLGGLFSKDDGSSAVSKEDQMTASLYNHFMQQDNMRYQMELNKQLQADAFNYNSLLSDKQFDQNKWFAQNNLINSYNQLKQLGINPLLMSPQGSGGSTGLANVGTSSVSLGNTASFDPANAVSANASSANAKIARLNAFTNILDKVTDIKVKNANSALMGEQATTEVNKRNLLDAEAGLKLTERIGKQIENINAPEWWKAHIRKENNEATAVLMNATTNSVLGDSVRRLNNSNSALSEMQYDYDVNHPVMYGLGQNGSKNVSNLLGGTIAGLGLGRAVKGAKSIKKVPKGYINYN